MEIKGEYRIPAPRQQVWAALNDTEVLRQCIPGCETLERTAENQLEATVSAKVGPVKARFKGQVTLSDLKPPESYVISGEGSGGTAGFARGQAKVSLREDGGETVLTYVAEATVGGKLAQIGSRLIDATARKMADEFFDKFSELAGGVRVEAPPAKPEARGLSPWIWVPALIALIGAVLWYFSAGN